MCLAAALHFLPFPAVALSICSSYQPFPAAWHRGSPRILRDSALGRVTWGGQDDNDALPAACDSASKDFETFGARVSCPGAQFGTAKLCSPRGAWRSAGQTLTAADSWSGADASAEPCSPHGALRGAGFSGDPATDGWPGAPLGTQLASPHGAWHSAGFSHEPAADSPACSGAALQPLWSSACGGLGDRWGGLEVSNSHHNPLFDSFEAPTPPQQQWQRQQRHLPPAKPWVQLESSAGFDDGSLEVAFDAAAFLSDPEWPQRAPALRAAPLDAVLASAPAAAPVIPGVCDPLARMAGFPDLVAAPLVGPRAAASISGSDVGGSTDSENGSAEPAQDVLLRDWLPSGGEAFQSTSFSAERPGETNGCYDEV